MSNEPRAHHYVPQFYLRNFAADAAGRKITTVAKHGHVAVWTQRSIESIGYERDFYVRMVDGVPLSSEATINKTIETPISSSETWQKIKSGNAAALDKSDKPILYSLIRHLEARTPHYRATMMELAMLSANPGSVMPFSDEERAFFSMFRRNTKFRDSMMDKMASSLEWTEASYHGCAMTIGRSTVRLRSSTTPVLPIRMPQNGSSFMPQPGMVPFQLVLVLDPYTLMSLALGNFGGTFANEVIDADVAMGLNRFMVGQFGHFEHVRHMITDTDGLENDMMWARYQVTHRDERKLKFQRPLY